MMRFLVLLIFLAFIYWYFFKKRPLFNKKTKMLISEVVIDKNCGTYIKKEEAIKLEIKDEICYFCSEKCLNEYLKKISKPQP